VIILDSDAAVGEFDRGIAVGLGMCERNTAFAEAMGRCGGIIGRFCGISVVWLWLTSIGRYCLTNNDLNVVGIEMAREGKDV
jgi:hypothetical protein